MLSGFFFRGDGAVQNSDLDRATLVTRELCCIRVLNKPSKQVGYPSHGLDPPSYRDPSC